MTGAPDVPGAVVGWRVWRVEASGRRVRLRSGVRDTVWPPARATHARCPGPHLPPARSCGCGLHAVTDPLAVMGLGPTNGVLGLAALWGEVIEGTHGWRASTGAPLLLFADPTVTATTRRLLAETYGVPVHTAPMPLARLIPMLSGRLAPAAQQLRAEVVAARSGGARSGTASSPAAQRILEARPHPGDRSIVTGPRPVRPPSRWSLLPVAARAVLAVVLGGLTAALLGGWFGSSAPRADLGSWLVLAVSLVALVVVVAFTATLVALSVEEGRLRTRVAARCGGAGGLLALVLYASTAFLTATAGHLP